MEYRVRRGGLVWPIMLISAGIIFLLNNLGIVDWTIWATLVRFWPVLLIAVGLDILIGRRSTAGSVLVALVLIAAVVVAVAVGAPRGAVAGQFSIEQINQGLDGAANADVTLKAGAVNLMLAEATESAGLIEGPVAVSKGERLIPRFWRTGDTAHYELQSQGVAWPVAFGDLGQRNKTWDLRINPDVPLRLRLEGGVGNVTANLTHLKVTRLDAQAGVGNTTVTLPRAGQVSVTIDGGVGSMRLIVPAGMAARIRVDQGLGGVDVSGDFQHQGDEYVTAGYDKAGDRADIRVKVGVGQLAIVQESGS